MIENLLTSFIVCYVSC